MPPFHTEHLDRFSEAAAAFPSLLKPRSPGSHKGSHGTLGIIGGAEGMSGALVLAATAAVYNGSGKVWAGFHQTALPLPLIAQRPEIMLATATALQERNDITAWVIGCGLGEDETAAALLQRHFARHSQTPLLLDADALNLTARDAGLAKAARNHPALIITPHPAEAARLLGCTVTQIQANRPAAAKSLSEKYRAVAVLKGHRSLIALPDGSVHTNFSGNPGLAAAGSGDVLSGLTGALLAQGLPPAEAARAGVWLHGAAADVLRENQTGEIGMLAGEIAPAARWLRNRLVEIHR